MNIFQELRVIPIIENNEPMVKLADFLKQHESKIILTAGVADYGAIDIETHALRQTVADKLLVAEKTLQLVNPKLTFKLTDSFRPLDLQKKYFDEIYAKQSATGLSGDELYANVIKVIADPTQHPPHASGGAIDMTIINWETNEDMDMGSVLDDVVNPLATTFHPDVKDEHKKNRLLLYDIMTDAGFVNAESEWWHYSYGDRYWAFEKKQPNAIYDSK